MEQPIEHWMPEEYEAGLFSVITPTYNRAHLIVETLDSVWAQTYRPIEVIVVDDGSSDDTSSVVADWEQRHGGDHTFRACYYTQENKGPSAARNRGLLESHGEFLQFLDSDDRLYPERLKKLAAVFHDPECDFIITGFDGFCAHCGAIINRHNGHPDEDLLVLALQGQLWINTLRSAFRRLLAIAIGPWNERLTCAEDYEYGIRALLASRKSIEIREILASARRGGVPRVSDQLQTHQGRMFQILGETVLRDGVRHRVDIPLQARQAFASRLYVLGLQLYARGWTDLGQCGSLAKSIGVELDAHGKRRRLAYRFGKMGGRVYKLWGRVNKILRRPNLTGVLSISGKRIKVFANPYQPGCKH